MTLRASAVTAGALTLFLALGAAPSAAAATTVTVSTTSDVVQAGDGQCSLREAALYANGTAETDCGATPASGTTTITVPAGRYALAGQPITLTASTALVGAAASTTTIDAGGRSQVLQIAVGASVTVSDVTISGGLSGQTCAFACDLGDPVNGNPGGGVSNDGTLALNRVIVTGNRTAPGATQANCVPQPQFFCPGGNGGDGAGVANFGTLTIAGSTITGNSTGPGASGKRGAQGNTFGGAGSTSGRGGNGGAIANFQTLTITNSTIAANATGAGARGADGGGGGAGGNVGGNGSSGGDGGSGGGIENDGALVISGTTISANQTGAGGTGGDGGNGSANVQGLVGKGGDGAPGGTGGAGGGIASDADMTISNSTIAENATAPAGASGHGGILNGLTPSQVGGANGGGIEELRMGSSLTHVTVVSNRAAGFGGGVDGDGGTITAGNSIIASNQAAFDQNCDGVITDQGGNVEFGDTSCPAGFLRADPRVSPLAGHGGPTQTIALEPGSPAIHHVRTCVLGSDQRGVRRPVGSACDSGAYQVAAPSLGGLSATPTSTTAATIAASVDPNLQDTAVVVNYGLTASYGSSTSVSDLGAGNAAAPFSAAIGGLAPGTTYHFDVVATNADGQTTSGDGVFTTLPPLTASIAGAETHGPTLSLTISCAGGSGPGTCAGPIRLTAAPAKAHAKKHKGKRPRGSAEVVAAGAYSAASGNQVTVKIALNRRGRALLGASYVLPAALSLRGTTVLTRGVTFRYPLIKSLISYTFSFSSDGSTSRVTQLAVTHIPRGGRVRVSCRGGGCPFAERTFAPRHGQATLTRTFATSRLRTGASVQVAVLAPNQVGKVVTLITAGGPGVQAVNLCLPPGAARPARCAQNHVHR